MMMMVICKDMGWTFQEYMDQPNWFIELIKKKIGFDNKKAEIESRKLKSKR